MKSIIILGFVATVSLLYACADTTYNMKRTEGTEIASPKNSSAYIALPKDGHYNQTHYTGSGAIVAQEIGAAFSPYLKETVTGTRYI